MEIFKGMKMNSTFLIMKRIGAAIMFISGIFFVYQFLVELNHPVNEPIISSTVYLIFFIIGILIFYIGAYKMDNRKRRRIKKRKKEVDEEKPQKQIVKSIQENEVASWKVDGMRQYFEHAKYELNVYIRDIEIRLKELPQQERELYIIHDLLMKLMNELISDEIQLSCADIYLIFHKLDIYHVHHEKRLYESYKINLSVPQQYQLDMLLDIRTREILRFSLKGRYAFLPDDLSNHLSQAVRSMEVAADEGNVFAQFDLANVYLSSEFYGGMEAAIFYLHRASNEHHSGAEQLLHQLQNA